MGRMQSFDTRAVVHAARELFWELGYEGSSLPEIERATGLNRSSLYNAFGSKRGLFDAAVESYLTEVVRPRLNPLQGDDVAADAVVTYVSTLREALQSPESMPARNGCLLINVAGSTLGHDKVVQEVVAAYRAEMLQAMENGIRSRCPTLDKTQIRQRAESCSGLVIAALVIARVSNGAAIRSLDAALEILEA